MNAQEVIERVKNNIVQGIDGNWVFWPTTVAAYQGWVLKAIADELERRNNTEVKLVGMTQEEWNQLMKMPNSQLTKEQLKLGWHWCHDFDGLLVGPNMEEMEHCTCHVDWEKVYHNDSK